MESVNRERIARSFRREAGKSATNLSAPALAVHLARLMICNRPLWARTATKYEAIEPSMRMTNGKVPVRAFNEMEKELSIFL